MNVRLNPSRLFAVATGLLLIVVAITTPTTAVEYRHCNHKKCDSHGRCTEDANNKHCIANGFVCLFDSCDPA